MQFVALAKFLAALSVALSLLSPSGVGASPYSNIYVFGDSLSDSGRLFAMIGWPGSPYYQGRFSNGPIWVESVAATLGLAFDPKTNYAFGGARSDGSNSSKLLPGLASEVEMYLATAKTADADGLYVVWAGGNDFFAGGADIGKVAGNIVNAVDRLKNAGARHILVGGLPDLGLTPHARSSGAVAALSATSASYNDALRNALGALAYPVAFVDVATLQQNITANPSAYGIQNVSDACLQGVKACGYPDSYLYWDDRHPTAAVHKLLASRFLDAAGIARFDIASLRLHAPAVLLDGVTYAADLQWLQETGGVHRFSLVAGSGMVTGEGVRLNDLIGRFDARSGALTLPVVQVNGVSHRANLHFQAPDRFELAPDGVSVR